MVLRDPEAVESQVLGRVDLLEPAGVKLGARAVKLGNIGVKKIVAELYDRVISLITKIFSRTSS